MDLVTFTQYLLQESSTAAVAVLALWMLRQSYKQRIEDLAEQRDEAREQRCVYRNTLTQVAAQLARSADVMQRLLEHLDGFNGRLDA